jgi:hypothetical protein
MQELIAAERALCVANVLLTSHLVPISQSQSLFVLKEKRIEQIPPREKWSIFWLLKHESTSSVHIILLNLIILIMLSEEYKL